MAAALPSIRRAHPNPFIFDLIEMNRRVIFRDSETKVYRRQLANRGHDRIRSDNAIALRSHQSDPGIQQNLLLKQDIEGRALANLRLLPYAIECDFGGFNRRR